MGTNLLIFAPRVAPGALLERRATPAEVISISDYRKTARRLRTPTGVYFVSRSPSNDDDLSAA